MNTLILDHIHKSFARIDAQDVTQALSGINFTVQDGEFLYIVEPSGCGKSTIMRLISGQDTERGMVFQKPPLSTRLTTAQNLDFTAKLKGYTKNPNYRAEDSASELLA